MAIVIPIIIFLVSVAIGFGVMYLIFNFKDIVGKSSETTAASVNNLVYYVTADGTPVFAQEDVNSTLVASLNRGDAVTVNSAGSLFSSITTSENVTGYILNEMISLSDPTAGESSSIMETDAPTSSSSETESSESESSTSESTIVTTEMTPQTQATTRQTTRATTQATTQSSETTPQQQDEQEPDEPDVDPEPEQGGGGEQGGGEGQQDPQPQQDEGGDNN